MVPVIERNRTESLNEYVDFMKKSIVQTMENVSESSDEQQTDIYGAKHAQNEDDIYFS